MESTPAFGAAETAVGVGFDSLDAPVADKPVFFLSEEGGTVDHSELAIPTAHGEAVPVQARIALASRMLDLVLATGLLLLLLPLMCICALGIMTTSRGPVLFSHPRIGRNGETFPCLKFRTMVLNGNEVLARTLQEDAAAREEWLTSQKLKNDPRVTRIGAFLRRYCLDELPQLFNVLTGQMSIVGPRPIVENEIVRFGKHFPAYCSVNPGLTGLWQVSGRHALSYEERVELDAAYAASKSLRTDLVILLRTVPIVLLGQNE